MHRLAPALALSAVALTPAALTPACAATRALVVGIDHYPGVTVRGAAGARDLHGAVADATAMKDALAGYFAVKPEEMQVLLDGEATRAKILDAFHSWLIDGTGPEDRAIFYFAGNGAQIADAPGGPAEDRYDEALAPSDTKGELEGAAAHLSGLITDAEFNALLAALAGREVLVVVDAAYSGPLTDTALRARSADLSADPAGQGITRVATGGYAGIRTLTPNGPIAADPAELSQLTVRGAHRLDTRLMPDFEPDAEQPADGPVLAVWTAAASAQLALEDMDDPEHRGLFTKSFIAGLTDQAADLNDNGRVSASELLHYVRAEAARYCAAHECGTAGVIPTLEAWDGYDNEVLSTKAATRGYETAGDAIASDDALPASDAGAVQVTLSNGGISRLGDALKITVESPQAGQLVILDVRDDGTTVQLFPNSPSLAVGTSAAIAAGERRVLPGPDDPFELVPDTKGSGRIVALVIDAGVPIEGVVQRYLDLSPIQEPGEYVDEITQRLNRTVVLPTGSDSALAKPGRPAALARGEARYTIK